LSNKIVRRSVLKSLIKERRQEGQVIVFTNGCFDILHVGHLHYLQEAKTLGDCLVVGVNSDDSVRRLKGTDRPFVPELERAEMLAGFECVDYVTIFNEPTAINLIAELEPDIYVKGGDYTDLHQIPEAQTVSEYGGKIVIVPEIKGKSTSRLVSQVRDFSRPVDRKIAAETKVVGIIPARLAATRLPNKPLLDIAGKPMIQWVYERANRSHFLGQLIVATPDEEIRQCVESFGGQAIMTSSEHRSGTDRLAEAARYLDADIVVNIQGDEPMLEAEAIDILVQAMLNSPDIPMSSLMCPLRSKQEEDDPSVVKVVTDCQGFALYFSRARIPYPRCAEAVQVWKHIGIYAYRRNFLIKFAALEPTPLEKAESLEQLRALENGYRIKMVETCFSPTSVDTPEDLDRVRQLLGR